VTRIGAAVKDVALRIRSRAVGRIWTRATPTDEWLDAAALEALAARYPVRPSNYLYDPDSVRQRGMARAAELLPHAASGASCLEIGSADGMTACALAEQGRRVIAIDIDVDRTDPRALAAGVDVRTMDAGQLALADESVDLVYSYNVFEHLPDPAATVAEVARVLRPGGRFVLTFGPLGWSPHGAHMYKAVGVPYVTVLCERPTIDAVVRALGGDPVFPWVNMVGIERYRAIFRATPALRAIRYREAVNRWHAGLVAEFAAHMRRAPSYESLLVENIVALFEKIIPGAAPPPETSATADRPSPTARDA
jgi:SAM-dependent methyltransferase